MFDLLDVPYMQRALLAGLLLAVPLGLLGVWVVLRGLAFFSHAVGVATFPGVVVGLGVPALGPAGGSLLAAGAFAAGVGRLERDHRVHEGAITGVALSAFLAVGAVLLTTVVRVSAPVESLLFGSLLAVSTADLVRCAIVAALGAALTALALPRLAAATFDAEWAAAAGARPRAVEAALLAAVALTVVAALPAVGSLLVSGLLVVPAATARLLCDRLGPMLAVAVALCATELVAGLALARALDVPPGASAATLAGVVFAIVAVVGRFGRRSKAGVTASRPLGPASPAPTAPPPAVRVEGLGVRFDGRPALEDVSFALPAGAFAGVLGPNGAGKTTLLRALLGVLPHTGSAHLGGSPSYVPQLAALASSFPVDALGVVLMGRYGRLGWRRRPGAADRRVALDLLERVELGERARTPFGALSGGQRQRALVARALAQEGAVLLLDEPLTGIDSPSQDTVLRVLAEQCAQGRTVLMSTHDLAQAARACDHLVVLDGALVAAGPTAEVFRPDVLRRAYRTELLRLDDGLAVLDAGDHEHP